MLGLRTQILSALVVLVAACGPDAEVVTDTPVRPEPSKRIALTFDDAPLGDGAIYSGAERTDALIAALDEAETGPVAFFVTTRGMTRDGGRDRVEAYAAAGHLIANHSHTHPWASRTDAEAYIADIQRADQELGGLENRRAWYRYPYLDEGRDVEKRDQIVEGLEAMGLSNGYVTVDNYDWYIANEWRKAVRAGKTVNQEALKSAYIEMLMTAAEFYREASLSHLGRDPAHVLLLHENDLAAEFIVDLVAALRAAGWEIISPDEAYDDPIADQIPATLLTGQGRVMALAVDAGADPRHFTHLGIEEAEIDALLAAKGAFGAVSSDGSD